MNARVIDEGPHHAVFFKPAGMTVVAGRGVPRPTLLDVAIERFPGAKPVHRLDRVTAGLCVVAKTPFGQQALSEAFRRHIVDKRYLALVEGLPAWDKLDIDARLARIDDPDARKGPLAHQTIDDAGVRALTRVRVLSRGDGVALLECRPETGRMHQIRAHLAHVGHPIVGDDAYGAKTKYVEEGAAKGIGLVALAISFPLPQGGRAFVTGPVPDEMRAALERAHVDARPVEALLEKFVKPRDEKPAPAPAKTGPKPKSTSRPKGWAKPSKSGKNSKPSKWAPGGPRKGGPAAASKGKSGAPQRGRPR